MRDEGTIAASAPGERIPGDVVHAVEVIDAELAEELLDQEAMIEVMHAFGFDDACAWLTTHRALYFEALRRSRPVLTGPARRG